MTANPRQQERVARARQAVTEQLLWMERCGSNLPGYVARYGSQGDGGEAIYRADRAELQSRMDDLDAAIGKRPI